MGDAGCGMKDAGWGKWLGDVGCGMFSRPDPAPDSPLGAAVSSRPYCLLTTVPALGWGTQSPCARSCCLPPPGWDSLLCRGSASLWQPLCWFREWFEDNGVWLLEAVEKMLWRQEQTWEMMCRQFGEGSGREDVRVLCEPCVTSGANASVFTQPVMAFRWTITLKFLILISFFFLLHFSFSCFPL